jgi:hypothetical protein
VGIHALSALYFVEEQEAFGREHRFVSAQQAFSEPLEFVIYLSSLGWSGDGLHSKIAKRFP